MQNVNDDFGFIRKKACSETFSLCRHQGLKINIQGIVMVCYFVPPRGYFESVFFVLFAELRAFTKFFFDCEG